MKLFALVKKPRLAFYTSNSGLKFLGAPVNADAEKPSTDLKVVLMLHIEWDAQKGDNNVMMMCESKVANFHCYCCTYYRGTF